MVPRVVGDLLGEEVAVRVVGIGAKALAGSHLCLVASDGDFAVGSALALDLSGAVEDREDGGRLVEVDSNGGVLYG